MVTTGDGIAEFVLKFTLFLLGAAYDWGIATNRRSTSVVIEFNVIVRIRSEMCLSRERRYFCFCFCFDGKTDTRVTWLVFNYINLLFLLTERILQDEFH